MTSEEMASRAAKAAIEDLRQTSFIPFWKGSFDVSVNDELCTLFRESRMNEKRVRELLEQAAAGRSCASFELKVRDRRHQYHYGDVSLPGLWIVLKMGFEWEDAMKDAWNGVERANPWCLSDNAVKMLEWLQGPKNTGEFASENRIGAQAYLRGSGSYSRIGTYLKEISLKTPHGVEIERSSQYGGDYKAMLIPKEERSVRGKFKNPVFNGNVLQADRRSREAYAEMLENRVLDGEFGDQRGCLLFDIHSRTELLNALPDLKEHEAASQSDVKKFIGKIRLARGLQVAASLEDQADEGWRLGAVLEEGWTWERARASIQEQRERENPAATYGLSANAAKILAWIWTLHDDELDLGMTPCVEAASKEQIGVEGLEYDQNATAMLELLVEEINDKTPYRCRLIPWTSYPRRDQHRILVKKQKSADAELVRRIQIRGLDKGVGLSAEAVEKTLEGLWKGAPPLD